MESHVTQQPSDVHGEVLSGRAFLCVVESVEFCEPRVRGQTFVDGQQASQQRVPAARFIPRRVFLITAGDVTLAKTSPKDV